MKLDWRDFGYLLKGSKKQKVVYDILMKINIFEILKDYDPVLIGTIPIEIDIEKSDLDIACEVYDFDKFEKLVQNSFDKYKGFLIKRIVEFDKEVLVSNFFVEDSEIEIYSESLPVEKQNGYRHMIIENRILRLGGNKLKEEIIRLKRNGLKTEPAFAKYMNLSGNPYDELLSLEFMSDEDLGELL